MEFHEACRDQCPRGEGLLGRFLVFCVFPFHPHEGDIGIQVEVSGGEFGQFAGAVTGGDRHEVQDGPVGTSEVAEGLRAHVGRLDEEGEFFDR